MENTVKETVKMVSLDTSSTKTGLANWENAILRGSQVIDHSKIKDGEIRIDLMCRSILQELNTIKPVIVVCELNVVMRNAKAQRMLSEIIGSIRGWCIDNDSEFVSLRPSVWRSLVKGNDTVPRKREEQKVWAIQKANEYATYVVDDDNEAEAILIGLARINQFRNISGGTL